MTAAFGVGGGVTLIAVMGFLMPVAALIPVHGAVQLGSNAGRMFTLRQFVRWDRVLPFAAGAIPGALAGGVFLLALSDNLLKVALGLFVIAVTWVRIPKLASAGPAVFAGGGLATSFATMFFGATGPLVAIFFANAFEDRRNYSASHAAAMCFQHGAKLAVLIAAGFGLLAWLPLIIVLVAFGYLGTLIGTRFLVSLPEERFRMLFRIALTLIALELIRRGLGILA